MKAAKTIDAKLNRRYDARFTLEFRKDKDGNEIGIVTIPYVHWYTSEENAILENVYEISGELLECVEKQFFDNHVVVIPVKSYDSPIELESFINHVVSEQTFHEFITGTYEITDDADKSIYGNMPTKVNKKTKPAKTDEYPIGRLINNPSFDAFADAMEEMIAEYKKKNEGKVSSQ